MDLKFLLLWEYLQFFSAVFLSVFGHMTFVHGQQNMTAEPGQNVVLPCRAPDSRTIIVVKWSRADLGSDYVLLYRDEQFDPENQHPSFRERVDLLDRGMKDGDVSLVLENLTTDDSGTYECGVAQRGASETRPISSVVLDVLLSGDEDGSREEGGTKAGAAGLEVGLTVCFIAAAAAAAAAGFLICRKAACSRENYQLPADQPPAGGAA